jgi:hypothetical protein
VRQKIHYSVRSCFHLLVFLKYRAFEAWCTPHLESSRKVWLARRGTDLAGKQVRIPCFIRMLIGERKAHDLHANICRGQIVFLQ